MPLQHLVDAFNQRFSEEQGLTAAPLVMRDGQVEGRFDATRFATRLEPVRFGTDLSRITGYDAATRSLGAAPPTEASAQPPSAIVDLDRLTRTVHMLNCLPLAHDGGHLFLAVHPRHLLTVEKDHGAYFEEIILRCGLTPRRIVITLTLSRVYDREWLLLLERLRNYRDRGYATALRFDSSDGGEFAERYCLDLLNRFSADFVRLDVRLFAEHLTGFDGARRKNSLLDAIRRVDTQLLVEGIASEADQRLASQLPADFLKGAYLEPLELVDINAA